MKFSKDTAIISTMKINFENLTLRLFLRGGSISSQIFLIIYGNYKYNKYLYANDKKSK